MYGFNFCSQRRILSLPLHVEQFCRVISFSTVVGNIAKGVGGIDRNMKGIILGLGNFKFTFTFSKCLNVLPAGRADVLCALI